MALGNLERERSGFGWMLLKTSQDDTHGVQGRNAAQDALIHFLSGS